VFVRDQVEAQKIFAPIGIVLPIILFENDFHDQKLKNKDFLACNNGLVVVQYLLVF